VLVRVSLAAVPGSSNLPSQASTSTPLRTFATNERRETGWAGLSAVGCLADRLVVDVAVAVAAPCSEDVPQAVRAVDTRATVKTPADTISRLRILWQSLRLVMGLVYIDTC
jgi:hypothetical protein